MLEVYLRLPFGPMAVCESCAGEEDEELTAVWPAKGAGDEPELWCEACRDRYPHEVAEDDEAEL